MRFSYGLSDDSDSLTALAPPNGVLPASDIGLMSPQITELLPNPDGTGNDATNEYIELYNPNSVSFDLTDFALQPCITSQHSYPFPASTLLPPKTFVAFYAKTTGLNLSNTGGQVKLIDPFGNSIASTDAYSAAKDGQSWALANGKWYWSTSTTPDAANIIKQPVSKKAKAASSKSQISTVAKFKGAKTAKPIKGPALASRVQDQSSKTPIHPWTLALVGSLALLYGAYEYRADMANRIYQLRKYIATRRTDRG